jgi:hypothetical protein
VNLTFDLDLLSSSKVIDTFRLVLSLYNKEFTSFNFLHKNYKVSRAITLLRFIKVQCLQLIKVLLYIHFHACSISRF